MLSALAVRLPSPNRTEARRNPGSTSHSAARYRLGPSIPGSPAARATTAPPSPASAMLTKYRTAPVPNVTLPTSMTRTVPAASRSAAFPASLGIPNVRTKSHPEPIGSTPSSASAAPSARIALTTSCTVPSPPAATRHRAPSRSASRAASTACPGPAVRTIRCSIPCSRSTRSACRRRRTPDRALAMITSLLSERAVVPPPATSPGTLPSRPLPSHPLPSHTAHRGTRQRAPRPRPSACSGLARPRAGCVKRRA
jgi:hypothetical protein